MSTILYACFEVSSLNLFPVGMKTGLSFQTVLGPFSCFDSYARMVKFFCACFFSVALNGSFIQC